MGPFKCPDCGVWWAGFEHRCAPLVDSTGTNIVIIPYTPPMGTASSTPVHYCEGCLYWHGPACPMSTAFMPFIS